MFSFTPHPRQRSPKDELIASKSLFLALERLGGCLSENVITQCEAANTGGPHTNVLAATGPLVERSGHSNGEAFHIYSHAGSVCPSDIVIGFGLPSRDGVITLALSRDRDILLVQRTS
jgi:hypothetical protein